MTNIITAALDKLDQDPKNVRKTHNAASIAELAASIGAKGLLQNLIVRKGDKKGRFLVTGGGRRLKALNQLAEAGKIDSKFEINCLLRENDEATEVSLAENVMREAMCRFALKGEMRNSTKSKAFLCL
jgi:ParB family chromosome partitioning protein